MCKSEQQCSLLIMIFFHWHAACVEKDTICSSILKANFPTIVRWSVPFSSLCPKHMQGDKVLQPFSLQLSGLYTNAFVGMLTVTEIEKKKNPQDGNIKKTPKNWNKFSFSPLSSFFISLTQLFLKHFLKFLSDFQAKSPLLFSKSTFSYYHFLPFPFESAAFIASSRTHQYPQYFLCHYLSNVLPGTMFLGFVCPWSPFTWQTHFLQDLTQIYFLSKLVSTLGVPQLNSNWTPYPIPPHPTHREGKERQKKETDTPGW